MKPVSLVSLIIISLLFGQCSGNSKVTPKIDYDQASVQLMQELAPDLVGTWKLKQVHVAYQATNYYQKKIPITSDTTFVDFATLTIQPASPPRTTPRDLRRGEYNGILQFRNKTYPVQFDLLANSVWMIDKKGPQASFSFSYNFPVGYHLTEPEEEFLNNVGLMNDGYSLELTPEKQTMVWRGYNRGVDEIRLIKQ